MDLFDIDLKLKNAIETIVNAQNIIHKQSEQINCLQTRNQKQPDFYKFRIIKQILKLICSGYDEDTAVQEVAFVYKQVLHEKYIRLLWQDSRRERNSINLYARIYMAKKMRLSGMKINEIAHIMNLSRNSITKLLNSHAVLD